MAMWNVLVVNVAALRAMTLLDIFVLVFGAL
jgi:hypothetical protein